MSGYTLAEINEIIERDEILEAEVADKESLIEELWATIRELKAQLNERCKACPTVVAETRSGQLYRPDADGVMQKIAWDE